MGHIPEVFGIKDALDLLLPIRRVEPHPNDKNVTERGADPLGSAQQEGDRAPAQVDVSRLRQAAHLGAEFRQFDRKRGTQAQGLPRKRAEHPKGPEVTVPEVERTILPFQSHPQRPFEGGTELNASPTCVRNGSGFVDPGLCPTGSHPALQPHMDAEAQEPRPIGRKNAFPEPRCLFHPREFEATAVPCECLDLQRSFCFGKQSEADHRRIEFHGRHGLCAELRTQGQPGPDTPPDENKERPGAAFLRLSRHQIREGSLRQLRLSCRLGSSFWRALRRRVDHGCGKITQRSLTYTSPSKERPSVSSGLVYVSTKMR